MKAVSFQISRDTCSGYGWIAGSLSNTLVDRSRCSCLLAAWTPFKDECPLRFVTVSRAGQDRACSPAVDGRAGCVRLPAAKKWIPGQGRCPDQGCCWWAVPDLN